MENNQSKIIISVSEGKFEISGSETFVTAQIENFKEQIINSLNKTQIKQLDKKQKDEGTTQGNNSNALNSSKNLEDYEDIFTLDGDKIKIIPEMSANTNAKKVVKLAVLFAYARKLQGHDAASVEEIKTECETHGLFDTNFSTNIRGGDPGYYTDKESGKARIIKINKPGEKYALAILKELSDAKV